MELSRIAEFFIFSDYLKYCYYILVRSLFLFSVHPSPAINAPAPHHLSPVNYGGGGGSSSGNGVQGPDLMSALAGHTRLSPQNSLLLVPPRDPSLPKTPTKGECLTA